MALLANIGQGIAVLINVSRSRNVNVRVCVCVTARVCQGHEEKQRPPVVVFRQAAGGCVAEGPGVILTPCMAPFPIFLVGIRLDRRGVSSICHILCSVQSSSVIRDIRTCRSSSGCFGSCSSNECVDNV